MKSKLDTTRDFIELYEYVAGEFTTPPAFHRWAAISLIAACLEDRVWLQRFEHSPLYPNVWVFLIGPSGTGKDHAMGLMLSLLKPEDPLWVIDGKVTIPALYDYMSLRQKSTGRNSAPIYLVSSDVTEQLPLGTEAKDFTTRALALYGGRDRPLLDITRTGGTKLVNKPLMNWIAGCTPGWFPQAIDPAVFASGFAARAFFIIGAPQYEHFTKSHPTRRYDREVIMEHLRARVEAFMQVEGLFTLTDRAQANLDGWLEYTKKQLESGGLTEVDTAAPGRREAGHPG